MMTTLKTKTMSRLDSVQIKLAERQKHYDPESKITPLFLSTEMGGEAGEALNVVKKIERIRLGLKGNKDQDEDSLLGLLGTELADVIITACNLANIYGIDLSKEVVNKFNEFSRRIESPITLQ